MRRTFYNVVYIVLAVLTAGFAHPVFASTLTDVTDQVSSTQISASSNHKFIMTLADAVSDGQTMAITFPLAFTLSSETEDDVDVADDGVDLTTAANCSGTEQVSVVVSGQTVTMTVCAGDGGAIASGSVVTIEIGTNASASGSGTQRITNPNSVGSWFVAITGTSNISGSVILATSTNDGASVRATVPAAGGSGGGGGGSGGGSSSGGTTTPTETPAETPTETPVETPAETPTETPAETPTETPTEETPTSGTETPTTSGGTESSTPSASSSSSGGGTTSGGTSGSSESSSSGGGGTTSVPEESSLSTSGGEAINVPEEEGAPTLPESPALGVGGTPSVPVTPSTPAKTPSKPATKPVAATPSESFVQTVANVAAAIEEIRALPEVQQAVDVAIPVATVAAATTAVVLASSFNLLSYLQFLVTSPFLLFARRKRKAFGIVYNAMTKVAVDLATVRLYDVANNRLIRSMVTDAQGKYFFIANPGQYRMTVTKNGFTFPSAYLHDVKDDGVFLDVYSGQTIEVTQKDATIAANIPLDPAEVGAQHTQKGIERIRLLRKLQFGLSLSGVVLSLGVWFFSPSILTMVLAMMQVLVFLFFWRLAQPRRPRGWGIVFDASNRRPVGNAVVRLFEPKYNKLVETTLTDTLGRYSFLVGPNEYFVRTDKDGYDQHIIRPIDYRQKTEPDAIAIDVPLTPTKQL